MRSAARDLTCVDLRGLGLALKDHARARGVTASELIRQVVAVLLENHGAAARADPSVDGVPDGTVKLTIRLRSRIAIRFSESARACGLSRGAYLARLIDEAPAAPLAIATELGRSTEQLAVVSGDMNELIRTLARGGVLSGPLVDVSLRPLLAEVRRHVDLAARLVSELRPPRTGLMRGSGAAVAGEEGHP